MVIELVVVEILPFEFESQLFAVKSVRKGLMFAEKFILAAAKCKTFEKDKLSCTEDDYSKVCTIFSMCILQLLPAQSG